MGHAVVRAVRPTASGPAVVRTVSANGSGPGSGPAPSRSRSCPPGRHPAGAGTATARAAGGLGPEAVDRPPYPGPALRAVAPPRTGPAPRTARAAGLPTPPAPAEPTGRCPGRGSALRPGRAASAPRGRRHRRHRRPDYRLRLPRRRGPDRPHAQPARPGYRIRHPAKPTGFAPEGVPRPGPTVRPTAGRAGATLRTGGRRGPVRLGRVDGAPPTVPGPITGGAPRPGRITLRRAEPAGSAGRVRGFRAPPGVGAAGPGRWHTACAVSGPAVPPPADQARADRRVRASV